MMLADMAYKSFGLLYAIILSLNASYITDKIILCFLYITSGSFNISAFIWQVSLRPSGA